MCTELSIPPHLPDYLHRKAVVQSNENYIAFWKSYFSIFGKKLKCKRVTLKSRFACYHGYV